MRPNRLANTIFTFIFLHHNWCSSLKIVPNGPININQTLIQIMVQVNIWTNDGLVYWCIYASLSFRLLMHMAPALHLLKTHDDVIKWKHFSRYWPFVREFHRSPVNSPHKGQWRRALMFSLIFAWINGWVNNGKDGDLIRHCAHRDIIVMTIGCDIAEVIQSFLSFKSIFSIKNWCISNTILPNFVLAISIDYDKWAPSSIMG